MQGNKSDTIGGWVSLKKRRACGITRICSEGAKNRGSGEDTERVWTGTAEGDAQGHHRPRRYHLQRVMMVKMMCGIVEVHLGRETGWTGIQNMLQNASKIGML